MKKERLKMEPVIREARKAYKASPRFELDRLLAEKRRWSRKLTIAENKLAEVNSAIAEIALENTPIQGKESQ